MKSKRIVRGSVSHVDRPDWSALEGLVRDLVVAPFMWMFEVELEDGARMDAYKHQMTREYLFVAHDGRVFEEVAGGRYREVEPLDALADACGEWGPWCPAAPGGCGLRAVGGDPEEEGGM